MSTDREDYGLPPVLTVSEAADFLRINIKTLHDSINKGDFPAKKIGRRTVILREKMLDFLCGESCVLSKKRR